LVGAAAFLVVKKRRGNAVPPSQQHASFVNETYDEGEGTTDA
jgi:hypothetical protein